MSYRNALAASWLVATFGCAALAAAQTHSGGSGARPAQPAPSATAPQPSTPAQGPGVPAPVDQPAAPVDQPATSPPPSSPPPSAPPAAQAPPPGSQQTGSQQTVVPGTPNASSTENTQRRNRARLAAQDTVPPASRGAGMTNNRPDCSQMSGIEKSECERRDTSRDDLPAGVTTTQEPKPPTATQGPPPQ